LTPFAPQPPQLAELVLVLVSQPLAALPSQSAKVALQVATWHALFTHFAVALLRLQIVPHVPQFALSPAMLVSQPLVILPSQSAKPALHVATLHTELTQLGVPFGTTQALPQPPQLFTSFVVLVSHVVGSASQSPRPALQVLTPHTPTLHVAEPIVVSQTLPHFEQLVTSILVFVSQPLAGSLSQSWKPSLQVT
jgi:hypothetical protein